MTEIGRHQLSHQTIRALVNSVCAEGQWMRTRSFEPTSAWKCALAGSRSLSHLLLITCYGEVPVGWCRVFPTDSPDEAEVGIGLVKPYREQGWGTLMLQQALDWARQRKLRRLTLTVRFDNDRAIHVFKKCGFFFTGQYQGRWYQMEQLLDNTGAKGDRP